MGQKIVIKGKTIFYLFIIVCTIVIMTIWITGLDIHRTVINNAFNSITLITTLFFTFVTYGLYKGVGLSDNFGAIKDKIKFTQPQGISPDVAAVDFPVAEFVSEGIGGILVGILLWIGVFILTIILAFFFETIVLAVLVIFTGALYWIFYRATRLILRYSRLTKNNLNKSMWIGFKYSLLYSAWIYGIIWMIHLLKK